MTERILIIGLEAKKKQRIGLKMLQNNRSGKTMLKIKIKTDTGVLVDEMAEIIEKTDGDGHIYCIAIVRGVFYRVIDRRSAHCPIWGLA